MARSFPLRALQSRKEKKHRAFFPELRPTALTHVRNTTDLHLLLLNPEKTSECSQRAVRSTDTNKQCLQERKPLDFKGLFGCYVQWVNKWGLFREWATRVPTDPRNVANSWGCYLYTNPSISLHGKHAVSDLSKEFGAFSVFLTKVMLTSDIHIPFCPVLLSATQATNTHRGCNGICGGVCVRRNSSPWSFFSVSPVTLVLPTMTFIKWGTLETKCKSDLISVSNVTACAQRKSGIWGSGVWNRAREDDCYRGYRFSPGLAVLVYNIDRQALPLGQIQPTMI